MHPPLPLSWEIRSDMWSFNHIYIENDIKDHPRTREILSKCSWRGIFYIDRYLKIFGRKKQDIHFQMKNRSLILARASGELLYRGSPMCQDYGRKQFYYTSTMKNCLYDCEYCYLKGMYDCGYIVIFVNIEDVFAQAERRLDLLADGERMYLSVSFDTDLYSFESLSGYCGLWKEFAREHPGAEIEIRTKGAPSPDGDEGEVPNLIHAYTLSPQQIIDRFEHNTAPLSARIRSVARMLSSGGTVRICIDPIIYVRDWKELYGSLIDSMARAFDIDRVMDFGIGTFRISREYLKRLRRAEPHSEAVWYPFEIKDGYAVYPETLQEQMILFTSDRIMSFSKSRKNDIIFRA